MKNWEQEKAYTEKRAESLRENMAEAIRTKDREKFGDALGTALRYMKKRERNDWIARWCREVGGAHVVH